MKRHSTTSTPAGSSHPPDAERPQPESGSPTSGRSQSGTAESGIIEPQSQLACRVRDLVREGLDFESAEVAAAEAPYWEPLRELGTELWLVDRERSAGQQPEASPPGEAGDSLASAWSTSFQGVVLRAEQLVDEVRRGSLDESLSKANAMLSSLAAERRLRELSLVVRARYALRVASRLGCRVSVPLDARQVGDVDDAIRQTRRLHEIAPERIVVALPFTPAGIVATRRLREQRIPIHCELAFSARQCYVATALASPSLIELSLGSLGAFVRENALGDGHGIGERAAIAAQQEVRVFTLALPRVETRLLVADFEHPRQLMLVAGLDALAVSPGLIPRAKAQSMGTWTSQRRSEPAVSLAPDVVAEPVRLEALWSVAGNERKMVEQLILGMPEHPQQLILAARDQGVRDLFPEVSAAELEQVASEGPLVRHASWADRIVRREVAIDSLLTLAGRARALDTQRALDEAIRGRLQQAG